MDGDGSMPVASAHCEAATRTAAPGPQPTSTTRSSAVRWARSATPRATGPRPNTMETTISALVHASERAVVMGV